MGSQLSPPNETLVHSCREQQNKISRANTPCARKRSGMYKYVKAAASTVNWEKQLTVCASFHEAFGKGISASLLESSFIKGLRNGEVSREVQDAGPTITGVQ